MAMLALAAAATEAAALAATWDRRWRAPVRAEAPPGGGDGCLPRWLAGAARHAPAVEGMPWPEKYPLADPARKEKMSAYEEAQRGPAAAAKNLAVQRACRDAGAGASRQLRLVSFNVHFMRDCFMNDNRSRVLAALREIDADVVALQEVALPGPEAAAAESGDVGDQLRAWWRADERAVGVSPAGGRSCREGEEFARGMRELGYEHAVFTPNCFFAGQCGGFCGNAVFSRLPPLGVDGGNRGVLLDKGRHKEDRCAALLTIPVGGGAAGVTIASVHLDVWAEGGYFGLAEGEMVRLLEFEELHHAARALPNVVVVGDFNAASRLGAGASELHSRLARATDECAMLRSAKACRHSLPRPGQRLPDDWALTVLGLAERRLGYRHCWQTPSEGIAPPLYSHWSGQLIDHCLLAPETQRVLRVTGVHVYHTDASDHLPLVIDFALA